MYSCPKVKLEGYGVRTFTGEKKMIDFFTEEEKEKMKNLTKEKAIPPIKPGEDFNKSGDYLYHPDSFPREPPDPDPDGPMEEEDPDPDDWNYVYKNEEERLAA